MVSQAATLDDLIKRAKAHPPIRVAVVAADQGLVLKTVREATSLGLIEPRLIGDPDAILACAGDAGIEIHPDQIVAAKSEDEAARAGVALVRQGDADVVMKGQIHTDAFMRALLDKDLGLRVPGRRVSHVFMVDIPTYPKLLAITDAAINIAPDLMAKAQILQNAIEVLHVLGTETPKVAVLSAVETVNPAIASTLDAACLALMAKRGQIAGALVDGPMAFDNAISADAAREKGIVSEVAGDVDILLVPDLVSGNILAKNLEYLAGATAAGIVLGLSVPVVLSSRADPPAARLAALALAVLMHWPAPQRERAAEPDSSIHCAPQPEAACCPIGT
tara:strand:- start:3609 stop:4610 length:1002 start_codon:yes stop_codon:yes gene_type:complete